MAKSFIFNGTSSRELGLKCKEINHITFSSKSYESIKIPGRTGNLIIDDGSIENKEITIIAYLDLRKTEYKKEKINFIKKWLLGHIGYKPLVFDDEIEYQAIVTGEVKITEIIQNFYELNINFECVEEI